jgi:DnaJ-class molecular chaperone
MGGGSYYEILGIDVSATEDDIRKAYRKQGTIYELLIIFFYI